MTEPPDARSNPYLVAAIAAILGFGFYSVMGRVIEGTWVWGRPLMFAILFPVLTPALQAIGRAQRRTGGKPERRQSAQSRAKGQRAALIVALSITVLSLVGGLLLIRADLSAARPVIPSAWVALGLLVVGAWFLVRGLSRRTTALQAQSD